MAPSHSRLCKKMRGLLILSCVAAGCSILFGSVSASLGENGSEGTIKWHEQWYEILDYGESTTISVKSQEFLVRTNASADLYLLDATEFGNYLLYTTLPSPSRRLNASDFTEEWTVSYLNTTYGLPIINETGNYHHVKFYILLANENAENVSVKFLVRLGYPPLKIVLNHISIFAKWLAITCFALVSSRLIIASVNLRKTEKESKRADTLLGSGLAYMFGFVAFFLGELRVYINDETGGFIPSMFHIDYNIPNFPINYFDLFICTLLMLGSLTFLALTYIVERKVKSRKIPIISYNQLVATFIFPFVFLVPALFVFAVFYLFAAIVLATAQIVTVYLHIAIKGSGILRKRAIFTLLGILLPVSCFIIRLFATNTLGDSFYTLVDLTDVFGLLCFWWGNIKFVEKPVQVST
nr:hypothetical protein [Candidatus Sigynarchaeota archaeon]